MQKKCAIIVLAAYDFESLQLTLLGLEHTVEEKIPIVIILNGEERNDSSKVECIARRWAAHSPELRFVVKPQCHGREPLYAIQEILNSFSVLQDIDLICKIDDDIIPLKKRWVSALLKHYDDNNSTGKIGFITGLINNNCWGFGELVQLAGKEQEYKQIMCYQSIAGANREKIVPAGMIDRGICGTVWQYPYLARWIHEWTSLMPNSFIALVEGQISKAVPLDIHYSIGCMLSTKKLWLDLDPNIINFDEKAIHDLCQKNDLLKLAVTDQPIIHLFYFCQRVANRDLIDEVSKTLGSFFNDGRFLTLVRKSLEDDVYQITSDVKNIKKSIENIENKLNNSSIKKLANKVKKFFCS